MYYPQYEYESGEPSMPSIEDLVKEPISITNQDIDHAIIEYELVGARWLENNPLVQALQRCGYDCQEAGFATIKIGDQWYTNSSSSRKAVTDWRDYIFAGDPFSPVENVIVPTTHQPRNVVGFR